MIIALILAPIASLLWATTNHIDKHMISKISINHDFKWLLVFSSLVAGMILSPFFLAFSNFKINIDFNSLLIILGATIFFLLGNWFYFKAMQKNDASIIIIMFQLIPVFGYFLGLIFLKEVLSLKQIIGGIIIILSSIAIVYEPSKKKFDQTKLLALILMILSSVFYAIYFFMFKLTTINHNYFVMSFWYQICLIFLGLLLVMFFKSFRNSFFSIIKINSKKVFGLNLLNEALNIIAGSLVNYSITLAPLALVLILNGLQPLFVFLIGLIGTIFFPKIFSEKISQKIIMQKVICIIFCIIGLIIMNI